MRSGLRVEHVLPFLKRWLWLIVLITIIPAVVLGARLRPPYTATARIQMTAPPDVDVSLFQGATPYANLRDNLTVARTNFIQAAYSTQVRMQAIAAVGAANADLAYLPSIQAVRDSDFIDISVDARTGELAAVMANAHANAAIAYAAELRTAPARAAVAFLTDQLQEAQANLEAAQSAVAAAENPVQADQTLRSAQDRAKLIESKLNEARLKSLSGYASQSMQLIAPAVAPLTPNSRKVQTQIAMFVLGGLAAGVLIAVLLDLLVRTPLLQRAQPALARMKPSRGRIKTAFRWMLPSRSGLSGILVGVLIAVLLRAIGRI